jgi:Clustered mitochondria
MDGTASVRVILVGVRGVPFQSNEEKSSSQHEAPLSFLEVNHVAGVPPPPPHCELLRLSGSDPRAYSLSNGEKFGSPLSSSSFTGGAKNGSGGNSSGTSSGPKWRAIVSARVDATVRVVPSIEQKKRGKRPKGRNLKMSSEKKSGAAGDAWWPLTGVLVTGSGLYLGQHHVLGGGTYSQRAACGSFTRPGPSSCVACESQRKGDAGASSVAASASSGSALSETASVQTGRVVAGVGGKASFECLGGCEHNACSVSVPEVPSSSEVDEAPAKLEKKGHRRKKQRTPRDTFAVDVEVDVRSHSEVSTKSGGGFLRLSKSRSSDDKTFRATGGVRGLLRPSTRRTVMIWIPLEASRPGTAPLEALVRLEFLPTKRAEERESALLVKRLKRLADFVDTYEPPAGDDGSSSADSPADDDADDGVDVSDSTSADAPEVLPYLDGYLYDTPQAESDIGKNSTISSSSSSDDASSFSSQEADGIEGYLDDSDDSVTVSADGYATPKPSTATSSGTPEPSALASGTDGSAPDVEVPLDDFNHRFQQINDELMQFKDRRVSFREKLEINERMFMLAHDFEQTVTTYGKIIATERFLPNAQKTIKPVNVGGIAGGEKYLIRSVVFKFAVDVFGLYGSDGAAAKVAGNELRALAALHNHCRDTGLRVPLAAIFDYRGLRIIAVSLLPLKGKSLVYGSKDGGRTVFNRNAKFARAADGVATRLNLAPHMVGVLKSPNPTVLSLCCDIEGHVGSDKRFYLLGILLCVWISVTLLFFVVEARLPFRN